MLHALLGRSKFKSKCKSALCRTKIRLEMIKKKRNAMQKFLKEDIAELLRNNLHRNAYTRAQGLYIELNLTSCYDYIEECCSCILDRLREMHQQRECPEECRVAASSLIYAAARFADLPELRDLRTQFNDKYGRTLEYYASKEFTEKLKWTPPTMEMKLQLMQDIAQEFSVTWDPKTLEEQLRSPTFSQYQNISRSVSASAMVLREEKKNVTVKVIHEDPTTRLRHSQSCVRSSEDVIYKSSLQYNRQDLRPGFSSSGINLEDNSSRKPFINGTVPAPYAVPDKSGKHGTVTKGKEFKSRREEEQNRQNMENSASTTKPRPRSVRTRTLKQSQSPMSSISGQKTDLKEPQSAKDLVEARYSFSMGDKEMKGGMTNGFLINYTKKKSQSSANFCLSFNNSNVQPMSQGLPLPPWRRRYLFPESQPPSLLKEAKEIILNL